MVRFHPNASKYARQCCLWTPVMSFTEVVCEYCEANIFRPTKEVNRSIRKGRLSFCNDSHATLYHSALRPLGTSDSSTRSRARRLWIGRNGQGPLCWCGEPADVHHKDGDRFNNEPENHETLCRSHHVSLENSRFPKRGKQYARQNYEVTYSDAGAAPAISTNKNYGDVKDSTGMATT